MINPLEYIRSAIDLGKELRGLQRDRTDSFRKEALRVINAFEAHDIPPNEVMRLLPDGMLDDPSDLANAQLLKKHLARISPWAESVLCLNPAWIKGRSSVPHQRVSSYKHLPALVEFLEAKEQESSDMSRFTLYVFKQDLRPVESSSGPMVVVLSEVFAEIDEVELRRYYYLSHGLEFGHFHSLLNLMQILALAHHHGMVTWGRAMKPSYLYQLAEGEGFIPALWRGELAAGWYPDDLLWEGLSGDPEWKRAKQAVLDSSLRQEGLEWLADHICSERMRLAGHRGQSVVTS